MLCRISSDNSAFTALRLVAGTGHLAEKLWVPEAPGVPETCPPVTTLNSDGNWPDAAKDHL
jgi:hypothetical protein